MTADNIMARVWNPEFWAIMVIAGVIYGALLWQLELRPSVRLLVGAMAPTLLFLLVIWGVRGALGTLSLLYLLLALDSLIWSGTAVVSVLVWRRWHGRKHR